MGGGGYFAFNKFKQEVSIATATPSPSPAALDFLFAKTPTPTAMSDQKDLQLRSDQPTPAPTDLPLEKNKKLSQFPGVLTDESLQNKKVVIQTPKGIIQIQIFPETKLASSNFIILAANGFYNGLKFHRVESGFVIQGGDPSGDGTGGPGYQFQDEVVSLDYSKGIVAMANAGPNTNGSQFFILLEDHLELPKKYTVFGQVISGMDVVEKLVVGDVMKKVTVQNLQ